MLHYLWEAHWSCALQWSTILCSSTEKLHDILTLTFIAILQLWSYSCIYTKLIPICPSSSTSHWGQDFGNFVCNHCSQRLFRKSTVGHVQTTDSSQCFGSRTSPVQGVQRTSWTCLSFSPDACKVKCKLTRSPFIIDTVVSTWKHQFQCWLWNVN